MQDYPGYITGISYSLYCQKGHEFLTLGVVRGNFCTDFPCLSWFDRNHQISWLNFYNDLEHIEPSSQMRLYKFCNLSGFKDIEIFICRKGIM